MLSTWLAGNTFAFFLVFARVGAVVSTLPGLSAVFVSLRIRLLLALAMSFLLVPFLSERLPALPETPIELLMIVLAEMIVGVFIGLMPRIIVAALHIGGTVIALTVSLANAMVQDPVADSQTSTISGFLGIFGLVMIFVSDLHHLMLEAIVNSYALFPPGAPLPSGDFAAALTSTLGETMVLSLQMAAPFLIVGFIYNLGLGLLGRLMPQLPVFFFGLPIQICAQLWIMMLTISAIMLVFLGRFSEIIAPLAGR